MTKESRGYLRDIKKMGENAKRPVEMYVEGDLTTTSLTLKSSKVESSKITMTKYGINFETPLKTKTNYINIGDKSNINIDLSLSQIHYLELNKDLLIDEFLNYDEGVDYYLITKQDETGGHDLDFDNVNILFKGEVNTTSLNYTMYKIKSLNNKLYVDVVNQKSDVNYG